MKESGACAHGSARRDEVPQHNPTHEKRTQMTYNGVEYSYTQPTVREAKSRRRALAQGDNRLLVQSERRRVARAREQALSAAGMRGARR